MENNTLAKVELATEVVDVIPVLTCFQKEARQKPLIILSHGFMGNKESWIPYLQGLAGYGYYAIALDNKSHGQRQEPDFASQAFHGGKLKVHEVRQLINKTAEDVSRLIDYFVATKGLDPNRIGMSGVSMGGFTTFRALVIEKRIKVAAPIIGSPFWDDIPQDVPIADDAESQQALDNLVRESSPALFPERFAPRPLLIQIGSLDRHYDVDRVKEFVEQLRENHYKADAYRLKLIVHKGVGHEFTYDMWANVMAWFNQYL